MGGEFLLTKDGKNTDTISVALCTYNGEKYITQQITSILEQTILPNEIIVCDDGSIDNTLDLVRHTASNSTIPIYIYQTEYNIGSTKNFEKAISLCTGSIIMLADQDDVWAHNKVEIIMDFFNRNPKTDAVFSNGEVIDSYGRPQGYNLWDAFGYNWYHKIKLNQGYALNILLKHNVVTGATLAIRANIRELLLPIPEIWVHDGWIALLVSAFGQISSINKPLIQYRQHAKQQIGAQKLSLQQQINKASQTGRQAYEISIQQYQIALERLLSFEFVTEHEYAKLLKNKIKHISVRAYINQNPKRYMSIFKEVANLNYFRYSNGIKSILKDIILK